MPGYVPIVMAPKGGRAGVPARAQIQQRIDAAKKQRGVGRKAQKGSGSGRGPRRKHGDIWPMPTDRLYHDVETLWAWVRRGACRPYQRIFDYRGRKMDIEEAVELMEKEKREGRMQGPTPDITPSPFGAPQRLEHLQGTRPQFNPAAYRPGVAPGINMGMPMYMPQQPEYLPTQAYGYQQPIIQPMPAPQIQFGMPQHVDYFQSQVPGFQNPLPQQMQVFTPALQVPVDMSQHVDYLQGQNFHINPDLYLPLGQPDWNKTSDFDIPDVAEDLQGQFFGSIDNTDLCDVGYPSPDPNNWSLEASTSMREADSQRPDVIQAPATAEPAMLPATNVAQVSAGIPAVAEGAGALQPQQEDDFGSCFDFGGYNVDFNSL